MVAQPSTSQPRERGIVGVNLGGCDGQTTFGRCTRFRRTHSVLGRLLGDVGVPLRRQRRPDDPIQRFVHKRSAGESADCIYGNGRDGNSDGDSRLIGLADRSAECFSSVLVVLQRRDSRRPTDERRIHVNRKCRRHVYARSFLNGVRDDVGSSHCALSRARAANDLGIRRAHLRKGCIPTRVAPRPDSRPAQCERDDDDEGAGAERDGSERDGSDRGASARGVSARGASDRGASDRGSTRTGALGAR